MVTSLVEVWIEMMFSEWSVMGTHLSLPLWKCGLKCPVHTLPHRQECVTSLVEVWIEIHPPVGMYASLFVTSLVEVWIEIFFMTEISCIRTSLPLWKCGLKCYSYDHAACSCRSLPLWKCGLKLPRCPEVSASVPVTSLVEVWIEILNCGYFFSTSSSHFPCGSVD